jgi:hypothetical protein
MVLSIASPGDRSTTVRYRNARKQESKKAVKGHDE